MQVSTNFFEIVQEHYFRNKLLKCYNNMDKVE